MPRWARAYDDNAYRHLEALGFDVLAHYLYYRRELDLTADEFVALLWQINPYYRVDMDEVSMLRELFGDDAPLVRERTLAGVSLSAVDEAGNKPLGDVLRRGLKLTATEWCAVVQKVDPQINVWFNFTTLGRLYRLARGMRLFGWDVAQGLALVELCENDLLADLTADPVGGDAVRCILSAFDRLLQLSRWMKSAELGAEALTRLLTPATQVNQQLQCTEQVRTWLRGLKEVLATQRVKEADFHPFTQWFVGRKVEQIAPAIWFAELREQNVIDAYGLVLPVSRSEIEKALNTILGKNLSDATGQDITPLADWLVQCQENQHDALASQVVQLKQGSKTEMVAPMLQWMALNAYAVLHTMLAWDYPDPDIDLGALPQLELGHDLGRYLGAIATLGLGPIEVALVAEAPEWLSSAQTGSSARLLAQLFYLHRFKALQTRDAGADAWATYLLLANSNPPPNEELRAQLNTILALLLSCPEADIQSWQGTGVAQTVEALDALARRVDLARELCLSAGELQSVLALNETPANPAAATTTACAAMMARCTGTMTVRRSPPFATPWPSAPAMPRWRCI